jgi:predicted ATPase/DNA-binding SARP family transcriptional activator
MTGRKGEVTLAKDPTGGSSARVQPVRIRLLGRFEVDVGERAIPDNAWRLRKAADLLKLLALSPGHRLHRDQALEILWPDKDPAAAANNLYQAIHAARSALGGAGGPRLPRLRDGVLGLDADSELTIDLDEFEAAVHASLEGRPGSHQQARQLYGGDLLPDDLYEEWADARRQALATSYRRVLADLAALRESEGRLDEAISALAEIFEHDQTDEDIARRLMRLEDKAGQRGSAVQRYASLEEALRRDLDVAPSPATKALFERIQGGEAETEASARWRTSLPPALTSFVGRQRELGEIELLMSTSRCVTLTGTGGTGKTRLAVEAARGLRGRFPEGTWLVELAGVGQAALVPRALGGTLGVREIAGVPLVERVAAEIGDGRLLLVVDNCEHVVEAAAENVARLLAACPNLRILATSRQPLRIAGETVMRVASLPVPDPESEIAPLELLAVESVQLFRDRAYAANTSFEITPLNARSVARLCHALDGLPLALELAASRTAAIPVDVLVDRLDERFKLLVGGDRTALTRQQTLEATLDWSYNLLSPVQQKVLRTVSVFAGGVSLPAAEQVCAGPDIAVSDVLPILSQLVDQSMLTLDLADGPPRYGLLETVREYGRRQAAALGERELDERSHLGWAVGLASTAAANQSGAGWRSSMADLTAELDNVRAALERGIRLEPELALTLAENLWPFWLWEGHLVEGRRWLERTLAAAPRPTTVRGRALAGLGALAGRAGDIPEHEGRARESVDVFDALGDMRAKWRAMQIVGCAPWAADRVDAALDVFGEALALAERIELVAGQAATLNCLAIVEWYRGRADTAQAMLEASVALFRVAPPDELTPQVLDIGEVMVDEPATGGRRLAFQETFGSFRDQPPVVAAAFGLGNLGMLARAAGEDVRAASLFEAALAEFERLGEERAIAHTLGRLGNLAAARGEIDMARHHLEACLEIRRRLADSRGVSLAESNLGFLETLAGRYQVADTLLTASADAFRRRGDMWGLAAATGNQASVALARTDLAAALQFLGQSLAASRSAGRTRWVAWNLVRIAGVEHLEQHAERARDLANEAIDLFRSIGEPVGEVEATRLM